MKYFSVEELSRSEVAAARGIENRAGKKEVENLERLVERVLDPARERFGSAVRVNSGYRCRELNREVGGAARSYHLQGRAADLTTGTVEGNRRLMEILRCLPHTELLWEMGGRWIHVAL